MFRPTLGIGYASFDVNFQQTWEQLSGSGLPTDPVNSTGTATGIYYYAGLDIALTKWLGLGVTYSMYTHEVDKLALTKATSFSGSSSEQPAGSAMRYLNSDATDFGDNYTVDLGYSEIAASLYMVF